MRATRRGAVAAALLATCLAFAAPSVAQTTTTLTVTPDTDLVDGDVVLLDGTGYTPSSSLFFCQGTVESADEDPDLSDCGAPFSAATANAAGEFSAQYTVRRYLSLPGIGTVDCAQPDADCLIGAANLGGAFAVAPITFTPQATASVAVVPDTDLVHGDVVIVEGAGFPASYELDLCQGGSVDGSPAGCEPSSFQSVSTNSAGEWSVQFSVRRFVTPLSQPSIDCAAPAGGCYIQAGVFQPVSVIEPITFAPQPPPDPIVGSVTDADGDPVAGADVWAYTVSDTWVGSLQTTTDAQGSYGFEEVEVGVDYRILFRPPSGSTLVSQWFDDRPGRETATVVSLSSGDFVQADAQLQDGATISGSVVDAGGNPLAGVTVSAFGPYDTVFSSYRATTGADGSYVIENVRGRQIVQPGTFYSLLFTPPAGSDLALEWYDDARTRRSAAPVSVSPGQTVTGIDAQLDTSGALSGAVTDANGIPMEGVAVRVYGPGDGLGGSYVASTAADGTYLVERVHPGDQYNVRFVPPIGSQVAAEWYDDVPLRTTAQNIVVTADQTVTGIDAALEPGP